MDVAIPIGHVFVFAALLLLSWAGGSLVASRNFQIAIEVHRVLVERFNELQTRYDALVSEHDELQATKWQMDAKMRELLARLDRLSAELHHYKNPTDEDQNSAGG